MGASVDEVVFRTLEKDRERRFQSAGEMKTGVEQLGEGSGTAPGGSVPAESGPRPFSHWSIYGALGVGLSLPVPLMLMVSLLTGRRGLGPAELWAALGSVALPGLGGTLTLRDLIAREWMGKSVAIEPGDERVLFKALVPGGGTLATDVGVRLKSDSSQGAPVAGTTETDEIARIRIRLAREQLEAAQRTVAAGLTSRQELAEVERRLAIAEARGDAVAVARANLKFAEHALLTAQANFEQKVIPLSALRIAESEQAIAEIELKNALQKAPANP